jgi:hypothetical protein
MADERIEQFWRYATSGRPTSFSLVNRARQTRVWFRIWAPRKAKKAKANAARLSDREARLAGHTVSGKVKGTPWLYLGAIDPETRRLRVTPWNPERASLPQTRAVEWLLARLAAGEWPLRGVELWHGGNCCRCYRAVTNRGLLPPYPVCNYDCSPVLPAVQAPRPTVTADEIDDELPANVTRIRRP